MHLQSNPFIQQAAQIQQHINPLIQNALQHGQVALSEFTKVTTLSQNMIPVCDDILQSLNSGNLQRSLASAQNLRMMLGQLNQSTQFLNNSIAQRMDMALFMMTNAHQRIGEFMNFIQGMRPQIGITANVTPYQQTAYYMA